MILYKTNKKDLAVKLKSVFFSRFEYFFFLMIGRDRFQHKNETKSKLFMWKKNYTNSRNGERKKEKKLDR